MYPIDSYGCKQNVKKQFKLISTNYNKIELYFHTNRIILERNSKINILEHINFTDFFRIS